MPEHRQALHDAAQTLGLTLDDVAAERLLAYLELLQKWNRVYNLTAVRDPDAMRSHHLYDCLAVVPRVREKLSMSSDALGSMPSIPVLDVGSGAGLPGVVLAICEPRLQVRCIDAVEKKTAFLRQVIVQLQLDNLRAVHGRVEQLQVLEPTVKFDLITARAFSSLAVLVQNTAPLLADGGRWMAMKARKPTDEIAELPSDIEVFHVEQIEVPMLDAERRLVWMRRQEQTVRPLTAPDAVGAAS